MAVILPSAFTDGTISVTNGSKNVTGTGMLFGQSVLPGDLFSIGSGLLIRIADVPSDTTLLLAWNWPGATVTNAPYEVILQPDNARMQETSRQLLEKMQSGNLDAFAGLAGQPNTVPVFTGPGAMTLVPLSDLENP